MRRVYAPANHPAIIFAVRGAGGNFVRGGYHCVEGRRGGGFVIRAGTRFDPSDCASWRGNKKRLRIDRDEYPPAANFAGNLCGRVAGGGGHGLSGVVAESAC